MSNMATSIRSSTAWSSACATGRSHRFIATWARGCFRSIGAAISKRSVSLVSAGIGETNFTRGITAWNGGLRLRPDDVRYQTGSSFDYFPHIGDVADFVLAKLHFKESVS